MKMKMKMISGIQVKFLSKHVNVQLYKTMFLVAWGWELLAIGNKNKLNP